MLNVSGHLISTAEIESVLVEHEKVAEAAVVAHPHAVKGECTYCFITVIEVRFLYYYKYSLISIISKLDMLPGHHPCHFQNLRIKNLYDFSCENVKNCIHIVNS